MDFEMACGTPFKKEEDYIIIDLLRKSDRWLTAEEISTQTGIRIEQVRRTLRMIHFQINLLKSRRAFLNSSTEETTSETKEQSKNRRDNMIIFIDEDVVVEKFHDGKLVELSEEYEIDDVLITKGVQPKYYQVEYKKNQARSSTVVYGSVNEVESALFNTRFKTYNEVASITETLKKFPQYSQEDLEKAFRIAVDRVKKHKHLDDKQEKIILMLFLEGIKKNVLLDKNICCEREIESTCKALIQELPYCYGFVNDAVIHWANSYNGGEKDFGINTAVFCKEIKIPKNLFINIEEKVVREATLSEVEKDNAISIIKKYDDGEFVSKEERDVLIEVVDKIYKEHERGINRQYNIVAKAIIDSDSITNESVIEKAKIHGLSPGRLKRLIESKGHRIRHRRNSRERSKKLKDYLED